jgi:REP element-mobilizing transposase RayT
MTRPRSQLVSLSDTSWYHVVSRCVRRAFLCGEDRVSGRNFDHRRGWIEARIRQLASVFTLDVAAYAVMSNHYHIVLRIDADRAAALSDDEVLQRWSQLFSGPLLVQRYRDPTIRSTMSQAELAKAQELIALYRARLGDLSWFMRVLNEGIARQANQEDNVKGRFWEGRFKSQALLDEQALLAAMAYVDLNPIRAGIAETPETSTYTGIEARLLPQQTEARIHATIAAMRTETEAAAQSDAPEEAPSLAARAALAPAPLLPFDATGREAWAIAFAFEDYVELVETLGRSLHPNKRGLIPAHTPRLLTRLGMDTEAFINFGSHFLQEFGAFIGHPAKLVTLAAQRQARFLRGIAAARRLFHPRAA